MVKNLGVFAHFDHRAIFQNHHLVGHRSDHRNIVGNQNIAQAPIPLQLGQQGQHLLGQADMPGVARTLHSLKGFIPVFCHAEFAAQLVDLEKRSRSDASPQMVEQVQALMQPLRQLVQESNSFLQQAGG